MKNFKNKSTSKSGHRKNFKKGDQCVQNPKSRKFREQVKKSTFAQRKAGGLTVDALQKHNENIEDEIDLSELAISDKESISTKKSKAFSISGLTDCSNMTFNKVWEKWNTSNALDQEKCAIVAAVTEVIRSRGGNETESEYFAALMSALESNNEENSVAAIIYLLSLVVKKLPIALLKVKYSEASKVYVELLEKYADGGRTPLICGLLDCLNTFLTSQELAVWNEASTLHCFRIILQFSIHPKPKIRKFAHHAINSNLKLLTANHTKHPVCKEASIFASKIFNTFTPGNANNSLYILNLMKVSLQYLNKEHMTSICESMLQLLSSNNLIVKLNSMQTFNSLFIAHPPEENLPCDLNLKILEALYDFQPSINDKQVSEAWMNVVMEGHANLSIIDESACLKILPKFYGSMLNFFQSDHREVSLAAARIMKETSEKCLEPCVDLIKADIEGKQSSVLHIFQVLNSGLRYKFQPVWDIVLQSLKYLFLTFGRICAEKILNMLSNLVDLYDDKFPFLNELKQAIGAAVKAIGPKRILDKRPLDLTKNSNRCEFPRAWLLPVLKENISQTEIQYFVDHFLPIAAHLREKGLKCRQSKQDLEAKVYETLQSQVWSLLPGFFTEPTDLAASFKNIAKILGTALNERPDLRSTVLQALRTLINKTLDDEERQVIGHFSKNYLPILFNLYTTEDEACQSISLSILETIKSFLLLTNEQLIQVFTAKILEKFSNEENSFKKQHLLDLVVCITKYCEMTSLLQIYNLAKENISNTDKTVQKKAYRILEEICDGNATPCKTLVSEKFEEMKSLFLETISSTAPSAKAPRLRCLGALVKRLESENEEFVKAILPEVILSTKEVGVKAKTAAFELLVDIGNTLVFLSNKTKEECVEHYFQFVIAGLAGSPHMRSATLLALTKLVFEYRYCISSQLVGMLLDAAITLLKSKEREVVKASLYFVRAVVKILDANELSGHLETLIKNLFVWNTKTKNAYRQHIRIILEKLDRKCGYQIVRSLVPEAHKKFIIQIHKTLERTKRQKEARRNRDREGSNDDEPEEHKESWEDILNDSDVEENAGNKRKSKSDMRRKSSTKNEKQKSWIVDGEETVDLLDPKVSKKIVATRPKERVIRRKEDEFEVGSDGKLLIKDDDEEMRDMDKNESKIDIGEKDLLGGYDKTPKQIKLGKRKHLEELPEDEEMTYKPGGHGIHRSRDHQPVNKRKFGEEYKAKKAKGDMKLKGKPDPYAYVPLDKQKLNKRKRAKLSGQYTGLLKAAKRGATKGSNKFKRKKL